MRTAKNFAQKKLSTTPPIDCGLSVGDSVEWENDYGVRWTHKIIGFADNLEFYGRFIHLDSDAYWFPHSIDQILSVNGAQKASV